MRAAREVFSELGYDAATFQAIALRADLTRPAINHYFSSKRILWAEVVRHSDVSIVSAGIENAHRQTTLIARLSAFVCAVTQPGADERSAAAFLVTSVLETQRRPELTSDEHDPMKKSLEFVTWAVEDAIASGELRTDADADLLVEMVIAVIWGMGFYAGFVSDGPGLHAIVRKLELLLANKLWSLAE